MHQSPPPAAALSPDWMVRLSMSEKRVALWLGEGFSNKEIASALGRAEHTVRNHVVAILHKAGTPTRGRFIALYQRTLAAAAPTPLRHGLAG